MQYRLCTYHGGLIGMQTNNPRARSGAGSRRNKDRGGEDRRRRREKEGKGKGGGTHPKAVPMVNHAAWLGHAIQAMPEGPSQKVMQIYR